MLHSPLSTRPVPISSYKLIPVRENALLLMMGFHSSWYTTLKPVIKGTDGTDHETAYFVSEVRVSKPVRVFQAIASCTQVMTSLLTQSISRSHYGCENTSVLYSFCTRFESLPEHFYLGIPQLLQSNARVVRWTNQLSLLPYPGWCSSKDPDLCSGVTRPNLCRVTGCTGFNILFLQCLQANAKTIF